MSDSIIHAINKTLTKTKRVDGVFINIAKEIGTLSHCQRAKVGAVLVNNGNIISFGYNGTPSGLDNKCEDRDVTKPNVIHAEMAAILKAARSGYAVEGATLYLTLSPCKECAKLILQSGVNKVVYLEEYRDDAGIRFLKDFIGIYKYETNEI